MFVFDIAFATLTVLLGLALLALLILATSRFIKGCQGLELARRFISWAWFLLKRFVVWAATSLLSAVRWFFSWIRPFVRRFVRRLVKRFKPVLPFLITSTLFIAVIIKMDPLSWNSNKASVLIICVLSFITVTGVLHLFATTARELKELTGKKGN